MGSTVTSGDTQGESVDSVYPTGIVSTDAAGAATVPVTIDLHHYFNGTWFNHENDPGQFPDYDGTATLFADGTSTFTINGQG